MFHLVLIRITFSWQAKQDTETETKAEPAKYTCLLKLHILVNLMVDWMTSWSVIVHSRLQI